MRIYRALLVAYPKKFRDHYETQMVQVFRDLLRDAYRHNGIFGVLDLWLHTFADLLVTALMERMMERSQHMFSPRFILWGGLASVLGGVMWLFPVLTAQGGEITFPLALLLTLAGLTALHARQGKQAAALGSSGFVLAILGTGLVLSFLVWNMISGNSLNPELNSNSSMQNIQLVLGMSILSIGYILIGLRTLRTKVLSNSTAMLSIVLGVLIIGLGISIWWVDYLISNGIDAWNPLTVPAIAVLLLMFAIGIFWMIMGAILAGDAVGLQSSNHPPTSA